MASKTMDDKQLEEKYGRRLTKEQEGNTIIFDDASELGYKCPTNNKHNITWSEFAQNIWCYDCKLDYPSSDCPIQRPCWMSDEIWNNFIKGLSLSFKPIIIEGIWHFSDCEIPHKTKVGE